MEVLNYENIKNQIEEFYKEKIEIERKVEDKEQIEKIITSIFGSNVSIPKAKDLFLIKLIGNITILKYINVDKEINKETEVIVLVKNNKPLFKLEHHERKNNDTEYTIDTYCTYQENIHYLESKINIETITNDTFKTSTVKILSKTPLDIREYFRREYTFYVNNAKIISFRTGDKMYIENEPNFENVLTSAIKLIDKTSTKVINHLENITLEDNVRKYKIRRKNN